MRFPLETAKELMRNLLGQIRPTDHFNVALFSGKLPAGTKAEIRIIVDATGRSVSTETRSGSLELGRCIAGVATGIQTAALASGTKTGTFTLTVELVEIGL